MAPTDARALSEDFDRHRWPELQPVFASDPDLESRIDRLLQRMSLEEKIGQMIQADHSHLTADEVRQFSLGAVLNGGNSVPGGDKYASPAAAVAEADSYWAAAMDGRDGRTPIPIFWGTDAVHGHNNMVAATIFPHNIGLGAARNPALVERIAQATALEVAVTGLDWTFAPTLAVAQDCRWGRSYESYSNDPGIVASLSVSMVKGLQGVLDQPGWLGTERVLACAKHFVGDGGTEHGIDQGDTRLAEEHLIARHAIGYVEAIQAGVQTIMASFSSWNGLKLHGHRYLLTTVLKDRLGFDGFVVGDWNGHGQLDGCSNTSSPHAINAGIDMLMAPDSWRELYHNTIKQAQSNEVPITRIEDAVRRILRVKFRLGLFDKPRPSERAAAGKAELLANPEHLAVARQAARESLVLLKNNGDVLPLAPRQRIMVAGEGADNIAKQCGGWTLSWQGLDNDNNDFPNGQSVFSAVSQVVAAADGEAFLSVSGEYQQLPDAVIVVFGEPPYAEFHGDAQHVGFELEQGKNLALLESLQASGIPTVAVFLSGRPLWTNPHINAADAFIAAWLPGSQGGAIADLIIAADDGRKRFDFSGRLPFPWPATASRDGTERPPQFACGYGLNYQKSVDLPILPAESGLAKLGADYRPVLIFNAGKLHANMVFVAGDTTAGKRIVPSVKAPSSSPLALNYASRDRQDDSIDIRWRESMLPLHMFSDDPPSIDGLAFTNSELVVDLRVNRKPPSPELEIALECGVDAPVVVPLASKLPNNDGCWHQLRLSMHEFGIPQIGAVLRQLSLLGSAELDITISRIAIETTDAERSDGMR